MKNNENKGSEIELYFYISSQNVDECLKNVKTLWKILELQLWKLTQFS